MSPALGFTTWFWQTIADLSADLDSDAANSGDAVPVI